MLDIDFVVGSYHCQTSGLSGSQSFRHIARGPQQEPFVDHTPFGHLQIESAIIYQLHHDVRTGGLMRRNPARSNVANALS